MLYFILGAQIPKLIAAQKVLSDKKGGKSLGGENLNISPLATLGYPEPLKIADVEAVIKKLDINQILKNGPKKSYMAQLGYMEREALEITYKDCNPLALYAVHECFSGGGGDLAAPQIAEPMLNNWRNEGGIESFKSDLLSATLKRYSAYSVFVFLILLVLDLIIESGVQGWPNGFF